MEKSLGNKRRRITSPTDERPKDPDYIGDLTALHGDFTNGQTRWVSYGADDKVLAVHFMPPKGRVPEGEKRKRLIISKVFDNEDFGFQKITVERPLRLNFHATAERIVRLDEQSAFINLATSSKKNEKIRVAEIEDGRKRQEEIRDLLRTLAKRSKKRRFMDRREFLTALREVEIAEGLRLAASELKAVVNALGERDETAEICRDRNGNPEPDPELRDTENVPLKEKIETYFKREVLPHVPDAWIDHSKTKIGYEIPLNRHFYVYEPPRPLEEIEKDIRVLESEIVALLKEETR